MSPNANQNSLRLLTSILVVASIANAAAVPHQVLDARAPAARVEELPTTSDIAAALEVVANEAPGNNVFDDLEDGFRSRTGLQVIKDFFGRLFGWDREDAPNGTVTVTVSITPTPAATSEDIVVPTLEPATTTEDVIDVPEITAEPSEEPMMSILPVGDMSTAINVTLPDPVFSDSPLPEETTVIEVEPTPTAIEITDSFTAVLPDETATPEETAIPDETVIVVTDSFTSIIPTETVISDLVEGTITISDEVTSVILVTATLVGTDVSAGTGLPIGMSTEAPMWANTTTIEIAVPEETEIPEIVTELPGTTVEVPIFIGNATAITEAPVETEIPAASTSTLTLTTTLPVDETEELPTEVPEVPEVEEPIPTEVPEVPEVPEVEEPIPTEVPEVEEPTTEVPEVVDDTIITEIPVVAPEPTTIEVPVVDVTEVPTVEIPVVEDPTVAIPTVVPVIDVTPDLPVEIPTEAPVIDVTPELPVDFPTEIPVVDVTPESPVDVPELPVLLPGLPIEPAPTDLPVVDPIGLPEIIPVVGPAPEIIDPLLQFPGQF